MEILIILGIFHALLVVGAVITIAFYRDYDKFFYKSSYDGRDNWEAMFEGNDIIYIIFLNLIVPIIAPLITMLSIIAIRKRPPVNKDKRVLELAEKTKQLNDSNNTIDELKLDIGQLYGKYKDIELLYQNKCSEVVQLKEQITKLNAQLEIVKYLNQNADKTEL